MLPKTQHLTPTSRLLHITWLCVPARSKALVYSYPPQKCYCTVTWPAQCSRMSSRMVQRGAALHTLGRWQHLWGCVGRWFLLHIICLQDPNLLVTAAALSQLERPAPLRQLCLQQWVQSCYCHKGFSPNTLGLVTVPCDGTTLHAGAWQFVSRLDGTFLKLYPDCNNFIWWKPVIQKWRTETATCSRPPELRHSFERGNRLTSSKANFASKLVVNRSPETHFECPSFRSHRGWNGHYLLYLLMQH